MSDYQLVQKQLAAGTEPHLLCMTCPWDRFCITPPAKTQADVDNEMEKAKREDKVRAEQASLQGKDPSMPIGTLITAVVFGNAATSCQVCPVLAMRLRLPEGRILVDSIREQMQTAE